MLTVFCRTRCVGFHYWPNAPDQYEYLRHPHRHEFHVEVHVAVDISKQVDHTRQVEFHALKQTVDKILTALLWGAPTPKSCEDLCADIAMQLTLEGSDVAMVRVSEDGECGAVLVFEEVPEC